MKADEFIKRCVAVLRMEDGCLWNSTWHDDDYDVKEGFEWARELLIDKEGPLAVDGEIHYFHEGLMPHYRVAKFRDAADVEVSKEIWAILLRTRPKACKALRDPLKKP